LTECDEIYCNYLENGQFLLYNHFDLINQIQKFENDALISNKKKILEKTPRHVWHIDYIRRILPTSKFLLTVREPVPTINSLYKRTGNLQQSIARYQDDTLQVIRQKNQKDVFIIKYEELVNDPKILVEKICKFVGIDYQDSFLNFSSKEKRWFQDGTENSHIENRNSQINKPIYKNESTWFDNSAAFNIELESWMTDIGNKIRNELRYTV
jgi:hypothetical protein